MPIEWMAVGVHWGFHLGWRVLPLQSVHFGVTLVLLTITLTLAGAVLLRGQGLRSTDPSGKQPGGDLTEPGLGGMTKRGS
jgi:hypothetical protein